MKFVYSLIIGAVSFGLTVFVLKGLGVSKMPGLPISVIIGILGIIFSFKKLNSNKTMKETIADGVSYVKTTSEDISSLIDDKDAEFYAIAEQEIKDDVINNGLWSQALVKAKGDENLRKIEYMKLRVKQLKKG